MTTDNLRTGGRAYFDNQKVEAAIYAYLDKRARKPEAPDADRNRAQISTQRRNPSAAEPFAHQRVPERISQA
jgi:hypothetical protein